MRRSRLLRAALRFKWLMMALAVCLCSASARDSPLVPRVTPVALSQAPVHLTAEQDRLRLLGLLGLKDADLRPAPVPDSKSPHATNYDEAKANVYPKLPDPLVFRNGQPVKTAWDWGKRRREIWEDFDREILGRSPNSMPDVQWHIVSTVHEKYGGVDVITKRLAGRVGPWMNTPIAFSIDLLLTVPAHAAGPVPVIMELAFAKDFELATSGPLDSYVPTPWGVDGKLVVQRGWGFAILNPVSYQKDDGSGLTEGIIGLANQGQPRKLEDWGVLKAWAWGAEQAQALLRDGQDGGCATSGAGGSLAVWKGCAGDDGLQLPGICGGIRQFVGRGWSEAVSAYLWRDDSEPCQRVALSLVRWKFSTVCGATQCGRLARG